MRKHTDVKSRPPCREESMSDDTNPIAEGIKDFTRRAWVFRKLKRDRTPVGH
jgi:hypothetical protein